MEHIFDFLRWAQVKYDDKIYGQWIEKLPREDVIAKREKLFFPANQERCLLRKR